MGAGDSEERVKAAAETYVYGYPLVYSLRETAGFAEGHSSLPVSSPWNEFGYARELLGPETTFVSPNNDTLYVIAAIDLRPGPLVLHVPDIRTIDAPEWRIDDRTRAYATRAAAARAGLYGNHGYEADYEIVYVDADGEQLNGSHRYELRLDSMPPVDAFWSLTMYNVPKFLLVSNPINRYSIGDRTPGLQVAEDRALTIHLQRESPGPDKDANWLPTPAGDFRPIMRMYQPKPEVLAADHELPAITRVG
jgi:hypothetical protein